MKKIKNYLRLIIVFLVFSACQKPNTNKEHDKSLNSKFKTFIEKKKFEEERFYPGIANKEMRPILSSKINQAAIDFQNVANSNNADDDEFQEQIKTGLLRFKEIYLDLDTEDRERVCSYFEELMDIVGLESSNGQLNKFMYDYDLNSL